MIGVYSYVLSVSVWCMDVNLTAGVDPNTNFAYSYNDVTGPTCVPSHIGARESWSKQK